MHQVCETQSTSDLTQQRDHEGVRRRRQTANRRTLRRTPEEHYGGIRRPTYCAGMLGVGVLGAVCKAAAHAEAGVAFFGFGVVFVLSFALVVGRLHNIGMSGWWSLLMLVPIACVYVGIKCLVCPEGYEDSKKLDGVGKLLTGVSVGFILLFTGGLILAIVLPQMHGLRFMPTSSFADGRDLSTPSSRLIGHWTEANGAEAYYASLDPSVGVGTFAAGTLSGRYKLVSEDRSSTHLVLMEFATIEGTTASMLADIDLSTDGLSMSQECIIGDSRFLLVYRYADGKTQP